VAHALGARVVALDVDQARLDGVAGHGVEQVLRVQGEDSRGPRKVVQEAAKGWGIPSFRHRVFECSGTAAGQALAFGLLGQASTLVFVGFTTEKVPVRLSNLMAFDATAHGSWGCAPEHYPAVLDLVLSGKVALAPFIEEAPLSRVNDLLQAMAEGTLTRRMVLCP
jgi:6-hydroxycyclohex-1-ene-1-carbonyl-CoA dehydrogenase